jgi:hypothetical protein
MKLRAFKLAGTAALLPFAALALPAVAQTSPTASSTSAMVAPAYAPITVAEVEAAQRAWGDALVAISTEYDTKGHAAAKRLAEQVLDSAYAYNMGPVLFLSHQQ